MLSPKKPVKKSGSKQFAPKMEKPGFEKPGKKNSSTSQPTPKKPVVRAGQDKPAAKKTPVEKFNLDGREKSKPINLSSGKPKTSPDKSDKNIGAKYNKPVSKTKGSQMPKFPR
jgi:hypothetical protein